MSHCRSLVLTTVFCLVISEGRKVPRDRQDSPVWVFQYPYAEDGSCVCKESRIGSYSNYSSEDACLEAFREDLNEYCSIDDGGLTDDQCDDVVSRTPRKTNMDCVADCTAVITGDQSAQDFLKDCALEQAVELGQYIAVPENSCFSSYVYGYGDFDPHNQLQSPPLSILYNVPSAAKCQGLCQKTKGCVSFTWRAIDDDENLSTENRFLQKTLFDFQNPAKTCLLFDEEYVKAVVETPLTTQSIIGGATKYCNVAKVESCALANIRNEQDFSIFDDKPCLVCDCQPRCVFTTGKHVSGPVFCGLSPRDICHFPTPPPPPTLPPCENCPCPTCPPTSPATRPPRPQCPDSCIDDCQDEYVDIDDCFPDC